MLNKKYLITTGCSFTEGHHLKEKGSWATYFAKNNNLELINLAKGGSGNEFIISQLIQYSKINKDIVDNAIFVIQLSECLRTLVCIDFPDNNTYPMYWHITPAQFIKKDGFTGWNLNVHHNKFIFENKYTLAPFYMNITNSVLITINAIIGLIDFCEANNYPYFIFDGLSGNIPEKKDNGWALINTTDPKEIWPVDVETKNDNYDNFFKHTCKPVIHEKIIEYISSNKNYFRDVTCKHYLQRLGEIQHNNMDYYTEGNQGHPNELGSNIWAEYIQPIIENLFGKIN